MLNDDLRFQPKKQVIVSLQKSVIWKLKLPKKSIDINRLFDNGTTKKKFNPMVFLSENTKNKIRLNELFHFVECVLKILRYQKAFVFIHVHI
jgi:hypothetical protein